MPDDILWESRLDTGAVGRVGVTQSHADDGEGAGRQAEQVRQFLGAITHRPHVDGAEAQGFGGHGGVLRRERCVDECDQGALDERDALGRLFALRGDRTIAGPVCDEDQKDGRRTDERLIVRQHRDGGLVRGVAHLDDRPRLHV